MICVPNGYGLAFMYVVTPKGEAEEFSEVGLGSMKCVSISNGGTAEYDAMYGGGAFASPTCEPSLDNANVVAAPLGGESRFCSFTKVSPVLL